MNSRMMTPFNGYDRRYKKDGAVVQVIVPADPSTRVKKCIIVVPTYRFAYNDNDSTRYILFDFPVEFDDGHFIDAYPITDYNTVIVGNDTLIDLSVAFYSTDAVLSKDWMNEDTTKKDSTESIPYASGDHQERTRSQVYATDNKWAIENFNATH